MAIMWHIYDIHYDCQKQDLPSEIIVDLNKFDWSDVDEGVGNLNHKVYKTIKLITGCNATSCKVKTINKI